MKPFSTLRHNNNNTSRGKKPEESIQMPRITKKFLRELWEFLKEARANTYASGAKPKEDNELPGFKKYVYTRQRVDHWTYIDRFAGSIFVGGMEVIYYRSEPVWFMTYGGGMTEEFRRNRQITKQTLRFLKKALLLPDGDVFQPRGGSLVIRGKQGQQIWRYHCTKSNQSGIPIDLSWNIDDIREFQGSETIIHRHTAVFRQHFQGGLIIS